MKTFLIITILACIVVLCVAIPIPDDLESKEEEDRQKRHQWQVSGHPVPYGNYGGYNAWGGHPYSGGGHPYTGGGHPYSGGGAVHPYPHSGGHGHPYNAVGVHPIQVGGGGAYPYGGYGHGGGGLYGGGNPYYGGGDVVWG